MRQQAERAAFEAWAKEYGRIFLNRNGDGYEFPYTQEAWVGWQARAARSGSKRDYDDAVEALRKAMCALPRYSFLLNSSGGVSRVEDRSGRWIEWDEAHKLFDPEVVDWLLAGEGARAAVIAARGGAA